MKGMLYTDAHGTLIFDKYEECSPKTHEKTCRTEVGPIGLRIKVQMLLLHWEMIMKNKNESFRHLYPVTAWMNELL